VLWALGEYSTSAEQIAQTFQAVKSSLGELPFSAASAPGQPAAAAAEPSSGGTSMRVLPDGTYATQSAATAATAKGAAEAPVSLRSMRASM